MRMCGMEEVRVCVCVWGRGPTHIPNVEFPKSDSIFVFLCVCVNLHFLPPVKGLRRCSWFLCIFILNVSVLQLMNYIYYEFLLVWVKFDWIFSAFLLF